MTKRALITNDDGIGSEGVIALATMAEAAGYDVLLAAPHRQSSGSAAGLWRDPQAAPVAVPVEIAGVKGQAFSVAGHPGLIALLAMTGQFGTVPDLVLSGINDASNLGAGVLHSGTAGAAIIGAAYGASAAAVSLYCDQQPDDAPRYWNTATGVLASILDLIADAQTGVAYNINVPNVPVVDKPLVRADWLPETCVPTLLAFIAGFHSTNGTTMTDPTIRRTPGTDIALVEEGHPTVSAIRFSGTEEIDWLTPKSPAQQSQKP